MRICNIINMGARVHVYNGSMELFEKLVLGNYKTLLIHVSSHRPVG